MVFSYQNAMGAEGRVAPFSQVTIGYSDSPSQLQEIGGSNFESAYMMSENLTVYGAMNSLPSAVVEKIDTFIKPYFVGTVNYL
jgi:hypothetical protein